MERLEADELDRIYSEANTADEAIFSEMRSNVLLVSGDHYQKRGTKFWERVTNSKTIDQDQKLRLTKNHIKKIVNDYVSHVLSSSPGTKIIPNNEEEVQDQKTAELNNSVLSYFKKTLNLRAKTRSKAEDYVVFGEVCSRTFFDPDEGDSKGYEPLVNDDGDYIVDEKGEYVPDEDSPVMEGKMIVERVYPFNLLRAPESQSLAESPYLIIRKMVKDRDLKFMVPGDVYNNIKDQSDETYMVFNGETGTYSRTKNETMVREHYYRPCKRYPNGYYYIATRTNILTEGELPFGKFPIQVEVFDKIPTSARGRSPIKQMRPYQVEINRTASAIATAQITLGDDKLILNHGARIAHGGQVPGVRGVSVTGAGADLKILPGRSGDQYLNYMNSQIVELYKVMGVEEAGATNQEGKLDPYALLYHSTKNKRRFSKYTEAFEEFTVGETEIILDLAKQYLDDDIIIPIIGRSEQVNIAEFKHSDKNSYRIKVEAVDTDAETMLGKQLAMNHTLQYVGKSLDKQDIGRILRSMPFINQEEAFSELTIDYDNAKNDILALERGEFPKPSKHDNHLYVVKVLVNRVKKPDFKFLNPKIQQAFYQKIKIHQQLDASQKQEILRMQQGLIPTDGYLVTCDFYVTHDDGKTKRVRLPYTSVKWLLEQLKTQGKTIDDLEKMNQGAMSEMAQLLVNKQRGQASPQIGQTSPMQTQGAQNARRT